jgi:hypothetical protein
MFPWHEFFECATIKWIRNDRRGESGGSSVPAGSLAGGRGVFIDEMGMKP